MTACPARKLAVVPANAGTQNHRRLWRATLLPCAAKPFASAAKAPCASQRVDGRSESVPLELIDSDQGSGRTSRIGFGTATAPPSSPDSKERLHVCRWR